MKLPVKYRELETNAWYDGATVNLGASGILFEAARALRPRTKIEMAVFLLPARRGMPPAKLVGRGTVVRRANLPDASEVTILAASIQHFRIVRDRRKPPQENFDGEIQGNRC